MEAKKQAGRSPAACFAEWPLSSPTMRPTRSVTASPQAPDPSLRRQRQSSLLPLRLLFPTRTASLGSCGGPEGGAHPAPKRISAPFFCQDSVPGLSRYHCLDRSGSLNNHSPVRTPYRLHAVSGVALDTILGTGTAVSIPSRKATSVAARVADVSLENQTLYHK